MNLPKICSFNSLSYTMSSKLLTYRAITSLLFIWMTTYSLMAQKTPAIYLEIKGVKALPFLFEKNNQEFQPVQIKAVLSVDSCTAIAYAEGNNPFTIHLKKGENSLEIPVKAVSTEKIIQLKIESKGMPTFQTSVILQPVKKLVCYILPHSHTDIGYTEIQTAIEDKQVQNLVKGMEIAKRTSQYPKGARFIWNVEVGWAADLYLNRMDESKKQAFRDAVTRGEIALNGMYLNVLTGLCRPEELSRLFKFSTELAKKCNVTIDAAMTSDIPGQTWGTVSAMSQAGIKYFSTAPNFFDRIGDILVQWENKPFYWVSPSGNEKVLVWIPLKGYALSHMIKKLSPEFVSNYMHQLDSLKYPFDIAHLRWSGHGDNAEPDAEICEFVKDFQSHYSWPKFIISSTSEAFSAFENKYGNALQKVKGDWTPYWEDGAGSSALETGMNRASSDRLSQAEALWAMKDPSSYPVAEFEEAWKKVLLYSEHTWGAWCSVTDPENKMTKEQWDIKKSYALDADKQSRQLLEKALLLTGNSGSSSSIDIYNTNSWTRSQLVLVPESLSKTGDRAVGPDKKPIPSQRLSSGELAILVKSVPPYSSKRFTITKGKAFSESSVKIQGNTLSNGLVSVSIDPETGAISELKSVATQNTNLVNASSGYGLNDFAFLESDKINDIKKINGAKISVKETGPLVASLLIESDAPGCNKLIREVRLQAGQEHVEITNIVDKKRAEINPNPGDWKFAQKGGKESVNFAFPFQVPNGTVKLDVPHGVMEPEKDQIPSACKNWLTANRWADISNGENGVALITLDAPLFEVGGITATMLGSQTNPDVWKKHIEPTQTLFSWALNNHWGTNYRAYQEGLITFRYALWPHEKFSTFENSQYAIGMSQPLLVKEASGKYETISGIYPDLPQVLVTAFKPCDDRKGRIMTLFNSSETAVKTKLISEKSRLQHIWMSNSGEDKKQEITDIEIPAWGVVIIRVE